MTEIEDEIASALIVAGHQLRLDEHGKPDVWALDVDPSPDTVMGHNGFLCEACLDSFCVWCIQGGLKIEPCSAANKARIP